jgi:hypothetical protein
MVRDGAYCRSDGVEAARLSLAFVTPGSVVKARFRPGVRRFLAFFVWRRSRIFACPWPSGKGTGLPNRSGGSNSRRALHDCVVLIGLVGNGRPPSLRTRYAVGSSPTWATASRCPSGPAVVAATLSTWRPWVRIPPRILRTEDREQKTEDRGQKTEDRKDVSAGHWRAQVAVTHPSMDYAGSTPARHTVRESGQKTEDRDSRRTIARW